MVTVTQAKSVARAWIAAHGATFTGYRGAYLAGSTCWLPADATLAPGTDVDVMVIASESPWRGKFLIDGLLLEISLVPADQVRTSAAILADYHVAPSFQSGDILDDPTGELARLQAEVRRHYADRAQVARRLDQVQRKIVAGLDAIPADAPFHMQVMAWIFPTAVTAHLILVAALRNPTVRKRYVAAKDVLTEYGFADRYPELLDWLGCASWTPAMARHALESVADVFDATAAVISPDSTLPWATDLHPESRPIAIDGMRELIDEGLHREAVFWLVVTWARCLSALAIDAPDQLARWQPGLATLTDDLGIASLADMRARAALVKASLPRLRALADEIVTRIPAVTDR